MAVTKQHPQTLTLADYAKTFTNGFSRRRNTNPVEKPWRGASKQMPALRFDIIDEMNTLTLATHNETSTETFNIQGSASKAESRRDNITVQESGRQ